MLEVNQEIIELIELDECFNCGKSSPKLKMGRCVTCYNYFNRTGLERPEEYWRNTVVCRNSNCDRPLATDPNARRHVCNACYSYSNKYKIDRPEKLCKPKNTCGWCSCGNQIILSYSEVEANFETNLCFVCRSKIEGSYNLLQF